MARIFRIVVPLVTLLVITTITWSWIAEYRSATRGGSNGSGESTSTIGTEPGSSGESTAGAEAPSEPYVRVITDGLNLRSRPATNAEVIKKLPAEERLELLERGSGWYRVRDAEGAEGWVAAGGRYSELVEP